jgi:hypothetical protein
MDVDLDRVRRNVVAMPENMIFDLLLGHGPEQPLIAQSGRRIQGGRVNEG